MGLRVKERWRDGSGVYVQLPTYGVVWYYSVGGWSLYALGCAVRVWELDR